VSNAQGEPWLVLGKQIDASGKEWQIGMPMADFQTHASIAGATGSGKSTLLRNLVLQFFGLGATVCVIEPHGDLVDDALDGCDNARLGQAVVLDLNSLCPPAIPLLTVGMVKNVDTAKQTAMSVLRVADSANWDASGQMREVLRHSLNVLLDAYHEQASLVWLKRFLSDAGDADAAFRERTLALCSREIADSRDYCQTKIKPALEGERGGGELKMSIRSALRRVDIFLEDRRFRRCLALPQLGPRINMVELLAGQRMVLAPVRKSELGEQAMQIFGTLLMWMVVRSLMGRSERSQRRQAAIVIDEFATIAGSEAGELTEQALAEARKYGASLLLAMQFLAQLPDSVRDAVKTNTLTKIIMNLPDPGEARAAMTMLSHPDLTPGDIQAIEKFHFYGKLTEHKANHPACYLKALPPIYLEEPEQAEAVEVPSRPRYSAETIRAHQMAAELHDPDDTTRSRSTIDYLTELDQTTWEAVIAETMAANRYTALTYLAKPDLIPDKVKRAKEVSGLLYGLQWWLRDAYYWRLKQDGDTPRKAPAKKKEVKDGNKLLD